MKSQVIEQILPLLRLPTHEQSKMRTELETHTFVELRAFLGVVSSSDYQAELAEEEILRVQAERAADFAIFQLERQRQTEPQRTREAAAQLAQDRMTFAEAAKTIQQFAMNEANFNVIRQTLGGNFSIHQIQQMLAANGAILSAPTQQELNEWESERIEQHNEALQRMDHDQLKARVREEAEARQESTKQDQATRELEAAKQRDQYGNFRPLPPEITAKAIKASSAVQLKQWMKVYGSFQITDRVRGGN